MEINKVKKCELLTFYESDFYQNLVHIPFTFNRLQSYINNPFSKDDEIILYYITIENKIISYRILLHDKLFNNEIIVWSCGNWTNSTFRKKGFSSLLYNEIKKDYNHRFIAYTRTLEAINFYRNRTNLFFYDDKNSKELHYSLDFLKEKRPFNLLKKLIDLIGKRKLKRDFKLFDLSPLNDKTNDFLKEKSEKELFPLTTEKIEWIKNYPWISTSKVDQKQIFDFSLVDFSFKANAFEKTIDNKVTAFYYRNIRQNIFYLHYVYYKNEQDAKLIAESILAEFNIENIKCIVVRDELIIKYIEEIHQPLIKKSYKNFLFIDPDKKGFLQRNIQHGIGELIFT